MSNLGFIKVAVCSPIMKVANPVFNICEIQKAIRNSALKKASVIVFPELCISGYTCGELFKQNLLLKSCNDALITLCKNTASLDIAAIVGFPMQINGALYNCAAVICGGKIIGIVPKTYIPNYGEFYETRWFSSPINILEDNLYVNINGHTEPIPFGNLLFKSKNRDFILGIEICEDLYAPVSPSCFLTTHGAHLIANLSASTVLAGKSDYRENVIKNQSGKCICGYMYASSGVHESTADSVFGGDLIIAENGDILKSGERFKRDTQILYSDIDVEALIAERLSNNVFSDIMRLSRIQKYRTVEFEFATSYIINDENFDRDIEKLPFIPLESTAKDKYCEETFNIQVAALAKRISHFNSKAVVVGVSGGIDSTLSLLVAKKTFDILNMPLNKIYGITMPGFGTTDQTYDNAVSLIKSLGVSFKEISIKNACLEHFENIQHDPKIKDVIYENSQARERTQILMDVANQVGGMVIGTGDLSEMALGWSTFNGDHMSMYSTNCGITKTLIRSLVKWIADNVVSNESALILQKVIDTPVSPELLPPDENGKIGQKTEEIVGPYELHDFFLYHTVKFGSSPEKILFMAKTAFKGTYTEDIIKGWQKKFYSRFFAQQFKRSCTPEGPKTGPISLSPRSDWRMPADADSQIWLDGFNEYSK